MNLSRTKKEERIMAVGYITLKACFFCALHTCPHLPLCFSTISVCTNVCIPSWCRSPGG